MTGRGNLFKINNTIPPSLSDSNSNTNSDLSTKDSGVGSRSPVSSGEYRRVGRGKLLDELTSACSQVTITGARGRARILDTMENYKSVLETESKESTQLPSSGRGRAKIFENIELSSSTGDDVTNSTSNISSKPQKDVEAGELNRSRNGDVEEKQVVEQASLPVLKHGNKGNSVRLACNYIRLSSDSQKGVYVYEVRFSPNVDAVNMRMKYLNEHRDKIGGTKTFDGVTLYLPTLLPQKLTTFVSKNISNNSEVEVRILFKRKESLKNCIHLFNVLFDRVMKTLNYVRFDRKQFDPTAPKVIPHQKLEVWPGYVTSVDEYEDGLMLCCDVSHRLLCQKTVLDTLVEIYQQNPRDFKQNALKALLGSVVLTRYNNRTYRIDDICFEKSPLSTFKYKSSEISYYEYYRTSHNIEIKDKKQPLLISIKKQRGADANKTEEFVFCLLPEVCFLTGMRDDMRSDFKLMREIATFTRVSPNQRLLALEKFYKNVNNCPEAKNILNDWGLTLNQSCEYITGRQYDEEQIYFAKRNFSAGVNADFGKYATSNELLEVVHLNNWILLHCKMDTKVSKSFVDIMERNSRALGIEVQRPKIVVLDNDRVDTFVNALRNNIKNDVQIAVCIVPTMRDDRYAAIKKICCAEMPIPSQVIIGKTLANESKSRSIVQKIALQMNCKLGGSLWSVKIPFKNVMICGIDSYHDAAQKGNSVAAVVASLNSTFTKWYSKAVIQTKREEIVSGLCSSFLNALFAYEKENGKLPDSVIIFRDGVGDGQLQICLNYEIPQFIAAAEKGFPNFTVKITFIVVQKRINTRYFSVKGGNVENPSPGTVVDHTITDRYLFDFFLVSQSVRQGTVSPSHYVVLRDDANYSPDVLQRLSYKLCFLYYNWPGTIRIPACCQYAHKMAYLIGQSVKRTTSEELATKLFYL